MVEPTFARSEVAKILNITSLTISNREKNGKYPQPKRDLNNYRVYSISDVFNLQMKTYNYLDPKPIISVLYDKGFTNPKEVAKIIDSILSKKGSLA
jgi:DNA-binding XRE family transcriptional regulator